MRSLSEKKREHILTSKRDTWQVVQTYCPKNNLKLTLMIQSPGSLPDHLNQNLRKGAKKSI